MRHILLLVAFLGSAPALAQRAAHSGTVGATTAPAMTTSGVATTDWHWMTSGIRAGEALWRNFWRGDHGRTIPRGAISREGRAGTFQRRQFGGELRSRTPDILTGASQRIDILTGRPID